MEEELRRLLEDIREMQRAKDVAIIVDPLSQELIHKAASPHSPISIDELSTLKHGLRDVALARLHALESIGVFHSKLAPKDGKTTRIFSITTAGRIADFIS